MQLYDNAEEDYLYAVCVNALWHLVELLLFNNREFRHTEYRNIFRNTYK